MFARDTKTSPFLFTAFWRNSGFLWLAKSSDSAGSSNAGPGFIFRLYNVIYIYYIYCICIYLQVYTYMIICIYIYIFLYKKIFVLSLSLYVNSINKSLFFPESRRFCATHSDTSPKIPDHHWPVFTME